MNEYYKQTRLFQMVAIKSAVTTVILIADKVNADSL